jgi:hypothetical protein
MSLDEVGVELSLIFTLQKLRGFGDGPLWSEVGLLPSS